MSLWASSLSQCFCCFHVCFIWSWYVQSLMTGAIVAGLCDMCSIKALYCPSPTEFAALHSHTAPCMCSSALARSLSWPNEVSLPHVGVRFCVLFLLAGPPSSNPLDVSWAAASVGLSVLWCLVHSFGEALCPTSLVKVSWSSLWVLGRWMENCKQISSIVFDVWECDMWVHVEYSADQKLIQHLSLFS